MPERLHREAQRTTRADRQPLRLNASDRRRVVVKFLRALPALERQILALGFLESLSAEEIAELTSFPVEDVRRRLGKLLRGVEAALVTEDDALGRHFVRARAQG